MKLGRKNKKTERILILSFIIMVILTSTIPYFISLNEIRTSILRLHVLANSDTPEDQNIKMAVRDRILDFGGDIFLEASSKDSKDGAKTSICQSLDRIRKIAREVIDEEGKDYDVTVSIENKYFNTRQYDDVTLPAGLYDSLVIRIGEAKGKNWWCVMFPPMCLPAATESEELSGVLDDEEIHIITDDVNYTVKFAVVEAFEELSHKYYED